jgi:GSH-dependent disulfide-bond oxidoreductase
MLDDGEDEPVLLYSMPTPNSLKICILLEELGVPYDAKPVRASKGQALGQGILATSPGASVPGIVDPDGPDGNPLAIFEADAILHYLARKYGVFYPSNERVRAEVDQWLFWQASGLGPVAAACIRFKLETLEETPYGFKHSANELSQLLAVIERRLSDRPFLAGGYSIADIASFPWVRTWRAFGEDFKNFPSIERWLAEIDGRPAVARALSIAKAEAKCV